MIRGGTLRTCIGLVVCLLGVGLARADLEVELVRGGHFRGRLDPPGEREVFHVRLPEGAKVKASLKSQADAGSPRLAGALRLLAPNGNELARATGRGSVIKLVRGFRIPVSGRYAIEISGDGVQAGDYVLKVDWKTPGKTRLDADVAAVPTTMTFAADAGAVAKLDARTKGKSAARPRLVRVESADGLFAQDLPQPPLGAKKHVIKDFVLPLSGDYVLTFANTAAEPGTLRVKVKTKQPKRTGGKLEANSIDPPVGVLTPNTGLIGRQGGTLAPPPRSVPEEPNPIERARLDVPAKAVDEPSLLQIAGAAGLDDDAPTLVPIGAAVFLGPPGQTFDVPVTVTLPFDPDLLSGGAPQVVQKEADGTTSVISGQDLVLDVENRQVSFETSHFTTFQTFSPQPPAPTETRVVASDGAPGHRFGLSVALDANTLLVGSLLDDDLGAQSGSAYVFEREQGAFVERQKLTADDGAAGSLFGRAVDVDGETLLVAASGDSAAGASTGALYVFTRSGSTWTQHQKLTAEDTQVGAQIGQAVALDADTAVSASPFADGSTGAAYVFTRQGTTWTQQDKLTVTPVASAAFAISVALAEDTIVLGASGTGTSGAAYVFVRSGDSWSEQQRLVATDGHADDRFGNAVGVDGDTIVVGAPGHDGAALTSGALYVFTRTGGVWQQQQKLSADDAMAADGLGESVAIDGEDLVGVAAGRVNGGAGYVFSRSGSTWIQRNSFAPSDAAPFGEGIRFSVDLSDGTAVAGARNTSALQIGRVYVYENAVPE